MSEGCSEGGGMGFLFSGSTEAPLLLTYRVQKLRAQTGPYQTVEKN